MQPVKLGIIGCGIAANKLHWPALQKLRDEFEIVLVCNNTEPKAQAFAEKVGAPYVLDYRALLADPDVEAVDIVLPIHLNYRVTREALEAGKHVIVEKPLATNLTEAREMLALASRFPQVKMVAENFYYHEGFHRVRALLQEGRIGEPYTVFWDVFRRMDENNKYAKTQWRIHHQYPGGFITDGGIHNIAALRLMFDDLVGGQVFTKSVNPKIGEIDSFCFQFQTAGGVHGVLNIFLSADGVSKNELVILGDRGTLRLENTQHLTLIQDERVVLEETIESDWGYRGEFEDFYRAIRMDRPDNSTFARAYRDLSVMIQALETARAWPNLVFPERGLPSDA